VRITVKTLQLDDDRALPAEPGIRAVAREVYAATRNLPLVCMHGHVDAALLADDLPFGDPASLLITPDHYVIRLIHAAGVPLEALGVPAADNDDVEQDPRRIWRTFCEHWHLFRGTPSRFWLTHELSQVFGLSLMPSADSADLLFDQLTERLAEPAFRPRALFEQFNIELLSTTDSPLADLAAHARLAELGWGKRVVPTFRPDSLVHVGHPEWPVQIAELGRITGLDTGDYAGYLAALRRRRWDFVAAGALATDHGHLSADSTPLPAARAREIYDAALKREATRQDAAAFAAHMLFEMARMSCEDGLVLQLHPGVQRDHHGGASARYGADRGFDIPVAVEFTRALRPLLEEFGEDPALRMVLFAVDETVYSRELAPLAGVYPSVRLGAPWWFLDSPNAMLRFREAVTETAGFYRGTGFVDDTRAFASIPARHDVARRVDAGYLARLVAEHQLDLDEAIETAVDLAYNLPLESYRRT
jgi:glucuronate isomerase